MNTLVHYDFTRILAALRPPGLFLELCGTRIALLTINYIAVEITRLIRAI